MVIPLILRRLSIALSVSILLSCGTTGAVKVYAIKHREGLVRRQQKEVLPFEKGNGFFCESPEDFRDTVTCTGGAVKVYRLKASVGGIVRSQAGEVLTYAQAEGYLCTSPTDFKSILDNCTKP